MEIKEKSLIGVVTKVLKGGLFMSLIRCPECNKDVSDKASSCPFCGCPSSSFPIINTEENKEDSIPFSIEDIAKVIAEGEDSVENCLMLIKEENEIKVKLAPGVRWYDVKDSICYLAFGKNKNSVGLKAAENKKKLEQYYKKLIYGYYNFIICKDTNQLITFEPQDISYYIARIADLKSGRNELGGLSNDNSIAGFLSFIPIVGSIIIWLIIAQGEYSRALNSYGNLLGLKQIIAVESFSYSAAMEYGELKNMGQSRYASMYYNKKLKENWFIPVIGFTLSLIMFFYLSTKKKDVAG